jgi:hypothetical protein
MNSRTVRVLAVLSVLGAVSPEILVAQHQWQAQLELRSVAVGPYSQQGGAMTPPITLPRPVAYTDSTTKEPLWFWAVGGAMLLLGGSAYGYSIGYVGGSLFDTHCYASAGSSGDAGATGGLVVTASMIALVLPIRAVMKQRGRGNQSERTQVQTSQALGVREYALGGLIGAGVGAALGAVGGAIHGGGRDACAGPWHAARDAALHLAAGGLLTSPVLLMPW